MIDIVMPYFNRKDQLVNSLKSIELSKYNEFQLTVIDDASDQDQRIEDLLNNFRFKINLVRVEQKEKKWLEPLALVNKTIRECQSKIIIYQCPECLHVGDIISYVSQNVKDRTHLAFACQRKVTNGIWWDVHSVIHPTAYPFCSAFMKEDYISIGGFDEEFAHGFTCCDDDLIDRIKLRSKIIFVDNPYVIHQFHPSVWEKHPNSKQLWEKNQRLLKEKRSQRSQENQLQKWKKPWLEI